MKILALISGGKDSIYNLCKCIDQGYEIVALGNLFNPGNSLITEQTKEKEHSWIAICIKQLEQTLH